MACGAPVKVEILTADRDDAPDLLKLDGSRSSPLNELPRNKLKNSYWFACFWLHGLEQLQHDSFYAPSIMLFSSAKASWEPNRSLER